MVLEKNIRQTKVLGKTCFGINIETWISYIGTSAEKECPAFTVWGYIVWNWEYVQLLFVFSLLDDSVDTDSKQGEQESGRTLKYI